MGHSFIYFFALVGSTVGGFVPALWGGSLMSLSSILFGVVGGVVGVYMGARLSNA